MLAVIKNKFDITHNFMKTFLLEIIPKIKRFSKKLDDLSVITNKHWLLVDEESINKTVFIFREKNNQLLVSTDGKIEKGTWEYLGNNSLIIDRADGSYLFKHGFVDDSVLALKVDGKDEYAILVNENQIEENSLDSIDHILSFLRNEYLEQVEDKFIEVEPEKIKDTVIEKVEIKTPILAKQNKLKYTFKSDYNETEFRLHKIQNKWGYIDKDNNVAIDFVFDDAFPFSENLACVMIAGKKGFIDRNGELVIEAIYDSATFFKSGKSEVRIGDESYMINIKGLKLTNR